jgi:hypothetical protein
MWRRVGLVFVIFLENSLSSAAWKIIVDFSSSDTCCMKLADDIDEQQCGRLGDQAEVGRDALLVDSFSTL